MFFNTKLIVEGAEILDDTIIFTLTDKNYVKVKFIDEVKRVFLDGKELEFVGRSITFSNYDIENMKVLSLLYTADQSIVDFYKLKEDPYLNNFYHFKIKAEKPDLTFDQLVFNSMNFNKQLVRKFYSI